MKVPQRNGAHAGLNLTQGVFSNTPGTPSTGSAQQTDSRVGK